MSSADLVALQHCAHTSACHKFTNDINHQTNVASMWRLIKTVVRKEPSIALYHSPAQNAQNLTVPWSDQSSVSNLPNFPTHVQETLSSHKMRHALCMSAALLGSDEKDDVPIIRGELCCAFASGKTTAPGDDGITYSVLGLLLK
ncbi:hypothetical protein SK128_001999, partial [Halocaridina rubra]